MALTKGVNSAPKIVLIIVIRPLHMFLLGINRDLSGYFIVFYLFAVNSFNCFVIYVLRSWAPLEDSVIFVLSVLFMGTQQGIYYSIV